MRHNLHLLFSGLKNVLLDQNVYLKNYTPTSEPKKVDLGHLWLRF